MLKEILWKKKFSVILDLINSEFPILDVGCHDGYLRNFFVSESDRNCGYIGIDIDLFAIRIAKEKGTQVILADANVLPIRNAIFNCSVLSEIIEHIPNPDTALSEVFRVLNKNKSIVVVVPNDLNFKITWCLLGKFNSAFKNRGHIQKFNYKKLINLCSKYGKISEIRGIPFNLPFSLCLNFIVKVDNQ